MKQRRMIFLKISAMILSAMMLFVLAGCENTAPNVQYDPVEGYGLHIERDGTVTLNGEKFYGYGTNWHGAFDSDIPDSQFDFMFKTLKDGGIPFIRLMMGIFYAKEVTMYVDSTERYFEKMDRLVRTAEKYQIGIVASLMWNESTFYNYCGETVAEIDNPYSKGAALSKKYITDVVTRYKDSPAIWAWEIGNEGNLRVDLDETHGVVHTSQQLQAYYKTMSDTIYAIDSYRMITGGDGCPRTCSYALRNGDGFGYQDTQEMVVDTLTYYNPGQIKAASMHVYGYGDADRFESLIKACRTLKLCCFVGEFGTGNDMMADNFGDAKTAEEMPEEAAEQECWNHVVDVLLENDVQIAAQWCYGRNIQIKDMNSIELGFVEGLYQNVYQWDRLVEVNRQFVEDGKNNSADYWKNAQNLLYKE